MKRRQLHHQTLHPYDQYPFEAFQCGSWHPVERLKVVGGGISTAIVTKGEFIEHDIPMSHLRVRSRKASYNDCTWFLRPGVDICVLHSSQDSENSADEPVWIDAKIRSVARKQHELECDCDFYISLYVDQGPDLYSGTKKLSKSTTIVKIDQISVLQHLEVKPCYTRYYRWCFSEDCSSVHKFRLLNCEFTADISWLLVTSLLKSTAFDIRTFQNHIVYAVSEYGSEMNDPPAEITHTLNFMLENGVLSPEIIRFDPSKVEEDCFGREVGFVSCHDLTELRRSTRRAIQPDRFLALDKPLAYEIEVVRFGENKTYELEYHKISSEDEMSGASDDDNDDVDTSLPFTVQADNEFQKRIGDEKWMMWYEKKLRTKIGSSTLSGKMKTDKKHSPSQFEKNAKEKELALVLSNDVKESNDERMEEMVSKFFHMNSSQFSRKKVNTIEFDYGCDVASGSRRVDAKRTRRKYHRQSSLSASLQKDCVYIRDDMRSFRKGSASAQLCRELIRRCMNNIDATLKNEPVQLPVVDQWKEYQNTKSGNNKTEAEEKVVSKNEEEISEIDMLWKEMELALASWFLLDEVQDSNARSCSGDGKRSSSKCVHDFTLNDEVGTVCQICGFVETEIKDILPPFISTPHCIPTKDQRGEDDSSEQKKGEDGELEEIQFTIPAPSTAPSTIAESEKNVWALIPDLKDKLRLHQKRAFEFLWRNIAGSLTPSRMEKKKKKRGGCVISHSPGAGKTLLIIVFLVSYLKLFPGSRPLVLAPKTTLYTWYKEIIKWKVPVPVYQIHGGQTYKGEVLKQRMKLAPGLPKNQDVLHVLDCLEKMQRWLSHPSILLMGYTSFLTLTREDSHYAHRKYMAQLLKQCPGILILDEGHNPRSTKSRLRKALMKVNTRLRVLLSGTLFQNNFGEYFNTLLLARPSFVHEVLRELDPKYEKRNKERLTQFSLENRGRKLLIDKISMKIGSSKEGERAQALMTLKKLTGKFINVYEGGNAEELPGLQCYTLMMKSTSLQQDILIKLQNQRPVYKGFPLELELLITLGAIHPWLIKTTQCSGVYFSDEELEDLEQYKFDMKVGSKVRFVMNLIPRCLVRNEKVLIFCHNIAPINLFLQIFERFYGWRKGREVLVLQGDIELFERGRVMDKFEEPTGPSKVMLASITASAEGISLTAASRVILLDSEWNPSKSKQAIARAFRPGQNKVVYVYQLLATGTLEEEKHSRTTWKEWVSDMIFSDELVEDPSHWQAPKIEDELLREIVEEDRAALFHRIMKNEKASNVIRGKGNINSSSLEVVS